MKTFKRLTMIYCKSILFCQAISIEKSSNKHIMNWHITLRTKIQTKTMYS